MSVGKVSDAKQELVVAGLITIDAGSATRSDQIEIEDIWPLNMATFATLQKPASYAEKNSNAYQHGAERNGAKNVQPLRESTNGTPISSPINLQSELNQRNCHANNAEPLDKSITISSQYQMVAGQESTTFNSYATNATETNTEQNERSSYEHSVQDTNTAFRTRTQRSPHEPKKEPIPKKEQEKNKPREEDPSADAERIITPWMQFMGALCWVCYGHDKIAALTKEQKGALTAEAKRIKDLEFNIDDLRIWYTDIWKNGWQYQKDRNARPNPSHVRTSIPEIRADTPEGFDENIQQSPMSNMIDNVVNTYKSLQEVHIGH